MMPQRPASLLCPLLLSLLGILMGALPQAWQEALQYQRDAIIAGEWWRLVSGHLVHLNLPHQLMNLLGLWLIWGLFFTREGLRPLCLYLLPALLIGTSLCLLLFDPGLAWYRGLSGALHGLLALALLRQWRIQPVTGGLLLTLFAAKIIWEQASGPLPGSEAWVAGRVIVDAHLYGAICGGLIWLLERSRPLFKNHEVTG